VEQFCGTIVSSSRDSQVTASLDATLEAWRNRPLSEILFDNWMRKP